MIVRYFAPQGRHVAPVGWSSRPNVDFSTPNFTPLAQRWGRLNFYAISEYKRPVRAYPLVDFYLMFSVCGQLDDGFDIKIWVDSLKELRSYVFIYGLHFPQIFSATSGETSSNVNRF